MPDKRLASFHFALAGLRFLFKTQVNSRIHLAAAGLAVGLGCWLEISSVEWAILVICIAVVVALEAMNTAIEQAIDLVSPDFHPFAGRAKDLAAGAVLWAAIAAAVVGGIVFLPKIWERFF